MIRRTPVRQTRVRLPSRRSAFRAERDPRRGQAPIGRAVAVSLLTTGVLVSAIAEEPPATLPETLLRADDELVGDVAKHPEASRAWLDKVLHGILSMDFDKDALNRDLARLGHEAYAVREDAHRRIRDMGWRVSAHLREKAALGSGDPEVRARIFRLIREVEADGEANRGQTIVRLANALVCYTRIDMDETARRAREAWEGGFPEAVIHLVRRAPAIRRDLYARLDGIPRGASLKALLTTLFPANAEQVWKEWKPPHAAVDVSKWLTGTDPLTGSGPDPAELFALAAAGSNRPAESLKRKAFVLRQSDLDCSVERVVDSEAWATCCYHIDGDLWVDTDSGSTFRLRGDRVRPIIIVRRAPCPSGHISAQK